MRASKRLRDSPTHNEALADVETLDPSLPYSLPRQGDERSRSSWSEETHQTPPASTSAVSAASQVEDSRRSNCVSSRLTAASSVPYGSPMWMMLFLLISAVFAVFVGHVALAARARLHPSFRHTYDPSQVNRLHQRIEDMLEHIEDSAEADSAIEQLSYSIKELDERLDSYNIPVHNQRVPTN
mmetsp:Transcript_660/g.1384  ORF Transcript_660/g.1384 Transcript_660/m.1384 type:complete len:183 (-) Transcript_660:248-796(-)